MAIFKIYDKTTKKWVPVASNEAIGIMTSHPALLKENQQETNVEEVLVNMNEEINTVKQNLTYMANQQGALFWEEI